MDASSALLLLLTPVALLGAFTAWALKRRARPKAQPQSRFHPSIVYTKDAIVRVGPRGETSLVDTNPSLGVVRLVERSRRRMLFIFSRAGSVSYVGATLRSSATGELQTLEAGATLVPDGLLPDGPFQADRCLSHDDAVELLAQARTLAPRSINRIVCASADSIAIDLIGSDLISGSVALNLDEPLVWRPLAFHETGGDVGGVFQGTWVDQGPTSVVFVSPLPSLSAWRDPHAESNDPEPFIASDPVADARALELSMSPAADPPPSHLRVSVDALLMFPLREALSHAPGARREHAPWHRRPTLLKAAR